MPLHGFLISACVVALLTTFSDTAEAVALRPNKATDDTVCDLSPNTSRYFNGSVLIPAGAAPDDQVNAYFRLASGFVTNNCANGQLLILHDMSFLAAATSALTQLANASCTAASVSRTEISVPFMDGTKPGFELRCVISKREELAAKLAELERADPLDSLKARLQAAARDPSQSGRASATPSDKNKDCGKMTLASLLQGGGCK